MADNAEERRGEEQGGEGKQRKGKKDFTLTHDFYQLDVELITSLYRMEKYVRNLENLSLI